MNSSNTKLDMDKGKERASTKRVYKITRDDLPLACPGDDMRLWDAHPKVYLAIEETGKAICPYCDAEYILENTKK